ncbi:MAG: AAA family ATPase, partial [Alphaproteobacteria bacterium]|nr:AAA family ATPase [Alphaproteobacteria bacterium]
MAEAADNATISKTSASGLTTHDLLAMLACGNAVELSDGTLFALDDEKARLALAFFLGDQTGRQYLATAPERGNADMARLAEWMETGTFPDRPVAVAANSKRRVWSLISVSVRQFGGLQPFCAENGTDAPDFTFSFTRPLFMAQGPNGAGKSSLARVLTFLLTGKVASSPEFQSFAEAQQINTYTLSDGTEVSLPSVVPMPTLAQWQARQAKGLTPVATSVTAVLKADDGEDITVRRTVVQVKNSFTTILEKNGVRVEGELAAMLGVPPLALELSALHMSRLAHLKLGHRESLADGVRALTGLREVAALAEKTAPKMRDYLGTTYATNQRKQAKTAVDNFALQIKVLKEAFSEAAPPPIPPEPAGDGSACQSAMSELKQDLEERTAKVRTAVATAAGVDEDKVELEGLDDKLAGAVGTLDRSTLNKGGLAALVTAMEGLSDEDIQRVRDLLNATVIRANDFAALQTDKLKIGRRRHY